MEHFRLKVKRLSLADWARFTGIPPLGGCVYCLILKGRIVYIGQTINLLSRLGKHQEGGIPFDTVTYQPCEPRSVRLKREHRLIWQERPPLNRVFSGGQFSTIEQVLATAEQPVVDHLGLDDSGATHAVAHAKGGQR